MRKAERNAASRPEFTFADLFSGIGGIRGAFERAGGKCTFSVEKDKFARLTYELNWGEVDALDVFDVTSADLGSPDVLAAGFPCQPFSLAGVSKKASLGRAHGFDDPISGNLFFQIVRLIGGPWDLDKQSLAEEAEVPDGQEGRFATALPFNDAPPVLVLENVKHLLTHDNERTYRVIRRRLNRSV
jgi:DNA (cytosine-5)-methyltransferase 1